MSTQILGVLYRYLSCYIHRYLGTYYSKALKGTLTVAIYKKQFRAVPYVFMGEQCYTRNVWTILYARYFCPVDRVVDPAFLDHLEAKP